MCEVVGRDWRGLVDADLGGGVIKQRIARKGGGRSRGFRAIVLFRRGDLAFSSTASPRAAERTCDGMNRKRSTSWQTNIWRSTGRASRWRRRLGR
ncbi:MAG: type II toxin-antitoxin system RelE/ParE family toxin [Rhodospirillaceae bacterium]|nr:type II toxin-antitoxin system RelE/ParE family toxin [Rhodospirillaceae bacterium]MCY4239495.1 type II toxin-antitoxin system RelE/ParE family toxin [Rhodospirillaceae bacterium]